MYLQARPSLVRLLWHGCSSRQGETCISASRALQSRAVAQRHMQLAGMACHPHYVAAACTLVHIHIHPCIPACNAPTTSMHACMQCIDNTQTHTAGHEPHRRRPPAERPHPPLPHHPHLPPQPLPAAAAGLRPGPAVGPAVAAPGGAAAAGHGRGVAAAGGTECSHRAEGVVPLGRAAPQVGIHLQYF